MVIGGLLSWFYGINQVTTVVFYDGGKKKYRNSVGDGLMMDFTLTQQPIQSRRNNIEILWDVVMV